MTKILSIAVLLVALAASGMARAADKVCASHLGEAWFNTTPLSQDADIPAWLREMHGTFSYGALGGVACATVSIAVNDRGEADVYLIAGPAPSIDIDGIWRINRKATIHNGALHLPYGEEASDDRMVKLEPIRPGVIRVTGNYGRTGLLARSQELATWNHPTFACEGAWPKVEQVHTSIASSRLAEGARYAGSWLGHLRHTGVPPRCVNIRIEHIRADGKMTGKYSWGSFRFKGEYHPAGVSLVRGYMRKDKAVLELTKPKDGKVFTFYLHPQRDAEGMILSARLDLGVGYYHGTLRRLPEDWTPPKVTSFTVPKPVPVKPTGEETVASAKDDWSYLDRNDP